MEARKGPRLVACLKTILTILLGELTQVTFTAPQSASELLQRWVCRPHQACSSKAPLLRAELRESNATTWQLE